MARQAEELLALGPSAVLIKGGHSGGELSTDLLFDGVTMQRFSRPRIATRHDHGTGCTLAAAITAGLAKGSDLRDAAGQAKDYLTAAMAAAERASKWGRDAGQCTIFTGGGRRAAVMISCRSNGRGTTAGSTTGSLGKGELRGCRERRWLRLLFQTRSRHSGRCRATGLGATGVECRLQDTSKALALGLIIVAARIKPHSLIGIVVGNLVGARQIS